MTWVLLILGASIALIGMIPYLLDTARGKTKPRIVTWFNWTLLGGIATAAAIADQQYPSAVLTSVSTVGPLAVTILGIKKGHRDFELFDVLCQMGAIIGLLLWIILDSPLAAILSTLFIDIIVGLPTWKHAWLKPYEETWVTFATGGVAGVCTLLAIETYTVSGLAYPLFLSFSGLGLASVILWSPHNRKRART